MVTVTTVIFVLTVMDSFLVSQTLTMNSQDGLALMLLQTSPPCVILPTFVLSPLLQSMGWKLEEDFGVRLPRETLRVIPLLP